MKRCNTVSQSWFFPSKSVKYASHHNVWNLKAKLLMFSPPQCRVMVILKCLSYCIYMTMERCLSFTHIVRHLDLWTTLLIFLTYFHMFPVEFYHPSTITSLLYCRVNATSISVGQFVRDDNMSDWCLLHLLCMNLVSVSWAGIRNISIIVPLSVIQSEWNINSVTSSSRYTKLNGFILLAINPINTTPPSVWFGDKQQQLVWLLIWSFECFLWNI